jgi:hypothetical protein
MAYLTITYASAYSHNKIFNDDVVTVILLFAYFLVYLGKLFFDRNIKENLIILLFHDTKLVLKTVLLHNLAAHNINVTGSVCYLTYIAAHNVSIQNVKVSKRYRHITYSITKC